MRFKGRAEASVLLLPEDQRRAPQIIAGRIQPLGRSDQKRHRTVDLFLGMADPLFHTALLVYQGRRQLRRVDAVAAHFQELGPSAGERLLRQLVQVIDTADRRDGKVSQPRTDN